MHPARTFIRFVSLTLAVVLVCAPGAAAADPLSDLQQSQQGLSQSVNQSVDLQQQLRLLDADLTAKAAGVQKLSEQAATARRELAAVNADLANMQRQRRIAQLDLNRYLRAEYMQTPLNEYFIIAGRQTLAESLAAGAYLNSLQDHADRIAQRLRDVEQQINERQDTAKRTAETLDRLEADARTKQNEVASVRAAKAQLLADTAGQQERYQQQYAQAKAQLEASGQFARLARQRGACKVWDAAGSYYNQLDCRWIDSLLGFSDSSTIGDYGCGVTSLAMVFGVFGITVTPPELNTRLRDAHAFLDQPGVNDLLDWRNTAAASGGKLQLVGSPYPLGRSNVDWNLINSQLTKGYPVIVYIDRPGSISHYVVLLGRQGSDYLMHDPIEGPYQRFSQYYSTDAVYQYITYRPA